jgi:hypothetical protein
VTCSRERVRVEALYIAPALRGLDWIHTYLGSEKVNVATAVIDHMSILGPDGKSTGAAVPVTLVCSGKIFLIKY